MEITIVNSLDESTWREFIDHQNQSNVFQTPEMFQVWNQIKGCSAKIWAAVDDKKKVLALFTPVDVTLRGGPLHRFTTRSIAYGSVLCVPGQAGKEALNTLLRSYSMNSGRYSLFTELRNLSDLSDIQPVLRDGGFVYEDYLDFLINLDLSSSQVFENIGSRTRKNIRRALRKNSINVEIVSDINLLPTWYSLLTKTYQAARVPLADFSLFETAFNILQPLHMITFWLARIGETYVAATAELAYKNTIYGWYSGVDRAYASECPGEVLMWRVLEWGAENGYKVYDFGGAGKPNEEYGVRDFKAKFGGQLVCYGRNTWIPNSFIYSVSKVGYSVLRRFL